MERLDAAMREIATLKARVQELEAQVARNSTNSSRPPSSDPPGTERPSGRKPSGRKRGGQPGHRKNDRQLVPVEDVTAIVPLRPARCRRCDKRLWGADPDPLRHQVTDLPKVRATVTEYQLHRLTCRCGATTCAGLPNDVPRGSFGPRLQALVAVASGVFRLPKRLSEELLSDVCGVAISLGGISKLEHQTSEAVAAAADEARAYVQRQAVVHADETGWREAKQKAWLWVAATATVAVFLVRRSRGAQVAKDLLGALFGGLLVTDRWNAYRWVDTSRRQLCWAHLIRDIEGFRDYGLGAKRLATQILGPVGEIFHQWKRVRDGTITRASFAEQTESLRRDVEYHLRRGKDWRLAKIAGVCREILVLREALWTFAAHDGVEPTNNHAERVIRPAVLWRKGSFGTDSERGSRFVERMLTVVTTLRLQKRNVLDWVTDACQAALLGQPAPSLLHHLSADHHALAA